MQKRCGWVTEDKVYMDYHDSEWGCPLYDDHQLFELLCLEGAQAGLSWLTILKRRENYREAFDQFDPEVIATYSDDKIEKLMQNERIIRNRLKIKSVVTNAKAYLEITEKEGSFASYIWSFVNHEPIINKWLSSSDVPAQTELSIRMSEQLKKDGFKFVGPTICYAYMQSAGLVNDHIVDCFCYKEVNHLIRKEEYR